MRNKRSILIIALLALAGGCELDKSTVRSMLLTPVDANLIPYRHPRLFIGVSKPPEPVKMFHDARR